MRNDDKAELELALREMTLGRTPWSDVRYAVLTRQIEAAGRARAPRSKSTPSVKGK